MLSGSGSAINFAIKIGEMVHCILAPSQKGSNDACTAWEAMKVFVLVFLVVLRKQEGSAYRRCQGSLQIDGGCVAQDVKGHIVSKHRIKKEEKSHYCPVIQTYIYFAHI